MVKRIKYIREILFGSMIPEFQGFRKIGYWSSDGQEEQGSERHDSPGLVEMISFYEIAPGKVGCMSYLIIVRT